MDFAKNVDKTIAKECKFELKRQIQPKSFLIMLKNQLEMHLKLLQKELFKKIARSNQ